MGNRRDILSWTFERKEELNGLSIHLSAKNLVDVPEDCEKKFAVLLALCLALNTGQVQ